jgi:hypothetical protein
MSDAPERPTLPKPADPRTLAAFAPFLLEPRCVGWKFKFVPGKNGRPGKWTKVPLTFTGRPAESDNPTTWTTADEIFPAVIGGTRFDGIGIMLLGLKSAFIDLDNVRDPATGVILPWARILIERSGAYCEITPSGAGVRLVGVAPDVEPIHTKTTHPEGGSFELFVNTVSGRFVTITGHRLPETPDICADITRTVRMLQAVGPARRQRARANGSNGAQARGNGTGNRNGAVIDLTTLSAAVAELIMSGTENGIPAEHSGAMFHRCVIELRRRGHTLAGALATFMAYPGGVASKFDGRLETELQRSWDKPNTAAPIFDAGYEASLQDEGAARAARGKKIAGDRGTREDANRAFFDRVYQAAQRNPGAWMLHVFPDAVYQPGTGAWRLPVNQHRPEIINVSISPSGEILDNDIPSGQGIFDLCPGDSQLAVAFWLCDRLGVRPADLGWRGETPAGAAPVTPKEPREPVEPGAPVTPVTPVTPARGWRLTGLGEPLPPGCSLKLDTRGLEWVFVPLGSAPGPDDDPLPPDPNAEQHAEQRAAIAALVKELLGFNVEGPIIIDSVMQKFGLDHDAAHEALIRNLPPRSAEEMAAMRAEIEAFEKMRRDRGYAREQPEDPEQEPPPRQEETEGGAQQPNPKPIKHPTAFPNRKAALNFFNNRYMLVTDGGRAWIYEQRYDRMLKRRYFSHIRPADFRLMYANKQVFLGLDNEGRERYINAAEFWITHPKRRSFLRGFVFHPDAPPGPDTAEETYNLWQGFNNIVPKPGSWDRLKQHLLLNISRGSDAHYHYLINWMAAMVQHPNRQGEICIVFIGEEGTGKSFVGRILCHLLGQHGFAASHAKQLTGHFNAHLRDTVFLLGDEAFYAGDKAHESILKALITDPTLPIEGKYRDTINAPNFLHMMLTANPGWVIPISIKGRRFAVYDVSTAHVRDFAYFKAIEAEMENGGYAAMLHELQIHDLADFNVRDYPDSEGRQEQIQRSLKAELAWWLDVLHRGYVWPSKLGLEYHFAVWHESVSTELLYASYREFAKAHGERRPMPRTLFGTFMRQLDGQPHRPDGDGVTGEHMVDVETESGYIRREAQLRLAPRPRGYSLGSLNDARTAFATLTKLALDWEGEP